jgi:hypothetical protein
MKPAFRGTALAEWHAAHARAEEQWQAAKQLRPAAAELFQLAMHDVARLNAAAAKAIAQPPRASRQRPGPPPAGDGACS